MERICIDVDKCLSVPISWIAKEQEAGGTLSFFMESDSFGFMAKDQKWGGTGAAFLFDDEGVMVAAFKITPIEDGRGRFFQCQGKLTIVDRLFGKTEYPLIFRDSNLGVGGFWMIQGVNHTARKLFRTPKGWVTLKGYRDRRTVRTRGGDVRLGCCLYSDQRKSHKRREGRGLLGMVEKDDRRLEVEDYILEPYRKYHYKGKITPYGRRALREFAKNNPRQYGKVKQVIRDYFPDKDTPLNELYLIREMVSLPNYCASDYEDGEWCL